MRAAAGTVVHRFQIGNIRGGVFQQLEVLAGNIQRPGAVNINGLGIGGIEGHFFTQYAGAQQVEAVAAQQIGFRQGGAGVDQDLKVAVLAHIQRRDVEEQVQGHFVAGSHILNGFLVSAVNVSFVFGVIAGVGVHIVHGLDHHGHGVHRIGRQILQKHPHFHVAVITAVHLAVIAGGFQGAAVLNGHVGGKLDEVDCHRFVVRYGGIGIHTIEGGNADRSVLLKLAQIVVKGVGAVGSLVFYVADGRGEVRLGLVGNEVEHGAHHIAPMAEGHLIGLYFVAVVGGVDGVSGDGGSAVGGNCHEKIVISILHNAFPVHYGVTAVAVVELVNTVILAAQGGIQHDADLYICHVILGGGDVVVDLHQAVLGTGGIRQGQSLGDGEILYAPGGDDGAACGSYFHVGAAQTQETVLTAKDVLFYLAVVTGDAQGSERGVVALGAVQQGFVIVGAL